MTNHISIFGLGYVGTVTAACLADRGCTIHGVDSNSTKVDLINSGKSPLREAKLDELLKRTVASGKLRATMDARDAVNQSDISLICVGTPSKPNGDLDLKYVRRVAEEIGTALATKKEYHTVILRSTVLPGTTWNVVKPILEESSSKRVGRDFGLCFNPEFLREGSAVADFYDPPFTIIGSGNHADAQRVRTLYDWLDAELIVCDVQVAEALKYVNNCFHAMKVVFANEVGRLCHALKIDSHLLMEIFCKDTRQNISPLYFKPGYAFGGSCLPKDLRAVLYQAKTLDVPMELFRATLDSNRTQMEIGVQMVEQLGNKKVGLLGLSFKAGTDDLRESPLVTFAETLIGRGYELKIFDEDVSMANLLGTNREYIQQRLPHIGALLKSSLEDVVEQSDTIVIGNSNPTFRKVLNGLKKNKEIVDLVRIVPEGLPVDSSYHGIGW
ncbi:MAG: UDP-glucose/GDP-mannose dehydrogenase family protein [Planctomycetes bacterium]|nr:UDP-glucose/GDP-mannose dehydrogenase family protein [Planctomycetota bacterium]